MRDKLSRLLSIIRCMVRHRAQWGHDGLNYYCPLCDEGWRSGG